VIAKIIIFFVVLFFPVVSFAGNPFVEPKSSSDKQSIDSKKIEDKIKKVLPPVPALAPSNNQVQNNGINQTEWTVVGKINDTVILVDTKGNTRLAKDGEMIGDCIIQHQELLCGDKKENELKKIKKTVDDLKKEIERLKSENNQLSLDKESEIKTLEESILSKDSQIRESKQFIASLEEKVKELNDQIETLEESILSKDSQIQESKQFIASLEEKVKTLSDQIEEKDRLIQSLTVERDNLKQKTKLVEDKLLDLQKKFFSMALSHGKSYLSKVFGNITIAYDQNYIYMRADHQYKSTVEQKLGEFIKMTFFDESDNSVSYMIERKNGDLVIRK